MPIAGPNWRSVRLFARRKCLSGGSFARNTPLKLPWRAACLSYRSVGRPNERKDGQVTEWSVWRGSGQQDGVATGFGQAIAGCLARSSGRVRNPNMVTCLLLPADVVGISGSRRKRFRDGSWTGCKRRSCKEWRSPRTRSATGQTDRLVCASAKFRVRNPNIGRRPLFPLWEKRTGGGQRQLFTVKSQAAGQKISFCRLWESSCRSFARETFRGVGA